MSPLPEVIYQNTDKQHLMDDWIGYLHERVLPLDTVCDSCMGVVRVARPDHMYVGNWTYYRVGEENISPSTYRAIVGELTERFSYEHYWNTVRGIRSLTQNIEAAVGKSNVNDVIEEHYDIEIYRGDNVVKRIYENNDLERYARDMRLAITRASMKPLDVMEEVKLPGGIYTFCKHCRQFVPVEMPGHVRREMLAFIEDQLQRAGLVFSPSTQEPPVFDLGKPRKEKATDVPEPTRSVLGGVRKIVVDPLFWLAFLSVAGLVVMYFGVR